VIWTVGALAMAATLIPCAMVALRGRLIDRLVGLELAGVILAQVLVLWAVAVRRPVFVDIGLTVGILAFGAGLVFARFLERWL
jgi:multisubunit Na+/H+ antiporter MnhF subunit